MVDNAYLLNRVDDKAIIELFGQRTLVLFAGTFQALASGIKEALGTEAEGVLYHAGIYAGRNSFKVLSKSWAERDDAFLQKWAAFYGSKGVGWFKIRNIKINPKEGTGFIQLTQSFSSSHYVIDMKSSKEPNPSCHFLMGFFVGVFEELSGKQLECEEIKCITKEDPYCEFILTGY